MADFTLSGLPLGNTEEFQLPVLAQLTGTLTVGAVIDPALLQANASANMSGLVIVDVTGSTTKILAGTAAFFGSVAFLATVAASPLRPLGLVGGGFIDAVSGGSTSTQAGFIPLVAFANLSGSLRVEANVSGLLAPAASLTGGLNHENFIGNGDVPGNELLSAAASANMTGEPDPLKDGGSPPFVTFDGVDQYLSDADTADGDLRGGANFSCVVVFSPEYLNNSGSGVLVGKHDPTVTEHGWRVFYDATTGLVTVTVSSAADGSDRAERTTAVAIRVRSVLIFTWDSTNLELYVQGASSQGAQTDTGTPGVMVAGDGQFAIGADDTLSAPANLFQGAIHAVHLFDDVLSPGEVATIDESGYVPPSLIDANLVAAWRPDRIEAGVANFRLTKWRDEVGERHLVIHNQPTCYSGVLDHVRWFSDDWDMDFLNAEIVGLSNDQNLSSDYGLSSSATNFVENGGFRRFTGTESTPPQIVTGFRAFLTDFTVIFGARKNVVSGSDLILVELLGLRVFYDAATKDLFVFQGASGTPTRYAFGDSNDFIEGTVPDGPVTVYALRYNSQLDQFTLFINTQKKFEEGTTATGVASSGTGLLFSDNCDWGAINPSKGQADRRAAQFVPSCLPDILIEQLFLGFAPDVQSIDDQFFSPTSMRAFLRRNPDPSLIFGFIVGVDYAVTRSVDDVDPDPAPTTDPKHLGSGTLEMDGLPLDGEQVRIDDGQGTIVTFEFDNTSSVQPGNVQVPITTGDLTQTLLNFISQLNSSALRLTPSSPVVFAPDGANEVGYVRLRQDDLADGHLPLSLILVGGIPTGNLRVTGPYRVRGPEGTLELLGQPADGDRFVVSDRINPALTFEFDSGGGVAVGSIAVTIGATVVDTMNNLVAAVNAATLAITARPTTPVDLTGNGTADGAYTRLVHARSSNPASYSTRFDALTTAPVNASGNLAAIGLAQPKPFVEAVAQPSPVVVSAELLDGNYIDSPYAVLEPEVEEDEEVVIPPFVNPNPVIQSVTADLTKTVTAVALAGPTDAGPVQSWWEVEIVDGDPQFNFRIDVQANTFSISKLHADTFPVPAGLNFDEKRIRFVIQSLVDSAQIWHSLYFRMEGENFDNSDVEIIILPGTGAPEPPPAIDIVLSLEEQAFVVDEDAVGVQRQLTLSNRSRYKLTRVFINRNLSPRIDGRNEDGLEFGLLSVLDDFLSLGIDIKTHPVGAGDVGFLDRVAVRFYGPGFEDFWWAIAYVNNISDPQEDMFVGQNLIIPPRERIAAFLARKPVASGS